MYSFISGKIVDKNPAYVVVDNHGIGYLINITLNNPTMEVPDFIVEFYK